MKAKNPRATCSTPAAPNQQAIPAVDCLMDSEGVKRWMLAGADHVHPRTTSDRPFIFTNLKPRDGVSAIAAFIVEKGGLGHTP